MVRWGLASYRPAGTAKRGQDPGNRRRDRPPSRQTLWWGRQPRAQGLGRAIAVTQRDAHRTQGPAGVEFRWGVRGPPGVLRAGVGGSEKRLEGWPGPDLRTHYPWRTDFIWAVLGAIRQETGAEWGGGRGREIRAGETSGRPGVDGGLERGRRSGRRRRSRDAPWLSAG